MAFGGFRLYANCAAEQQACIRDLYIEQHGICVNAMLPVTTDGSINSQVDKFGDKCATNRQDVVLPLIPLYEEYRTLIDIVGEDLEDPLPLECLVRSCDYWPQDTIFRLPWKDAAGFIQDRFWRVISQDNKHLEVTYARKIKVVPARDHYVEGIN